MASFSGVVLTLGYAITLSSRWRRSLTRGLAQPLFCTALAAAGLLAVVYVDQISSAAVRIVYKRTDSIAREFQASRGMLVDEEMENFRKAPWLGIGFGVPSNPNDYEPSTQNLFGVPLRAPTEKGVLPMAVLEETGVVGAAMFLIVLGTLLKAVARTTFPLAAMAVTVLLNNAGEANLFAFGGMGLYYWLILGYALYGAPPDGLTERVPAQTFEPRPGAIAH
jgi:hypothetical protein